MKTDSQSKVTETILGDVKDEPVESKLFGRSRKPSKEKFAEEDLLDSDLNLAKKAIYGSEPEDLTNR